MGGAMGRSTMRCTVGQTPFTSRDVAAHSSRLGLRALSWVAPLEAEPYLWRRCTEGARRLVAVTWCRKLMIHPVANGGEEARPGWACWPLAAVRRVEWSIGRGPRNRLGFPRRGGNGGRPGPLA